MKIINFKKLVILVAVIAIIALAVAARFYGYRNRKRNDNLPSLASIAQMDEAEVNKIVCGYHREQLADVWGDPDESNSMEDIWVIESCITLTVNYHNNNDKTVMCDLSNQ